MTREHFCLKDFGDGVFLKAMMGVRHQQFVVLRTLLEHEADATLELAEERPLNQKGTNYRVRSTAGAVRRAIESSDEFAFVGEDSVRDGRREDFEYVGPSVYHAEGELRHLFD